MLAMHTSPLQQPGRGDAGGLNVYVDHLAGELGSRGIGVDVFTRSDTAPDEVTAPVVVSKPGVQVLHVDGDFVALAKEDLPAHVDSFADAVANHPGRAAAYDVIHAHYWLSGLAGLALRERLDAPLVVSMHTLAAVKNADRPPDQAPEPALRTRGEELLASHADRLIANTAVEAEALHELYGAPRRRIVVVHPGVELDQFSPGSRTRARREIGLDEGADSDGDPAAPLILFVGRIQPLKGLEVLVRAAAVLRDHGRAARIVAVGAGDSPGTRAVAALVERLSLSDAVRLAPPVPHDRLAPWFRAADIVAVPSYSESFGLVALEAQASGVPVLAARVGGLETAVDHCRSGLLVDGHDPADWARELEALLADPARRDRLGEGGVRRAARSSWERSARHMLDAYCDARADWRRHH